jgi:ribosomal protein L22
MGLKKLAAKVAEYNERLANGKAGKIKPDHIRQVLDKLEKKAEALEESIATETSEKKKAVLQKKLNVARTHIERAKWLLTELD